MVTLHWSAPANDMVQPDVTKPAASYDVRYNLVGMTEAEFYDQSLIAMSAPQNPGSRETLVVSVPTDDTYYFNVKSTGTYGPRSGISNGVAAVRVQPPPHDPPIICN